jgi:hypothetical protein
MLRSLATRRIHRILNTAPAKNAKQRVMILKIHPQLLIEKHSKRELGIRPRRSDMSQRRSIGKLKEHMLPSLRIVRGKEVGRSTRRNTARI